MKSTTVIKGPVKNLKKLEYSNNDTILIPELEEAAKTFVPRGWTKTEIAVLKTYYNRVSMKDLMKHLPGKSKASIRSKAQNMRIGGTS